MTWSWDGMKSKGKFDILENLYRIRVMKFNKSKSNEIFIWDERT